MTIEVVYPKLASREVCKYCRACVSSCTVQAIVYDNGFKVNVRRCYQHTPCQEGVPACIEACPTGAIKAVALKAERMEDLPERLVF